MRVSPERVQVNSAEGKNMARTGRRTKLTAQLQAEICTLIAAGNSYYVAAALNGIHRTTFFKWMNKGRNANHRTEFRDFFDAVTRASAEAENAYVTVICEAGKKDWRASAWWLERRYPARWGRKRRAEISGPTGDPIQHEVGAKEALMARTDGISKRRTAAEVDQRAILSG
jgi:hypothetical protein